MAATDTGSRRRPYPYDAYIGNVRVLLEPDQDGALVSESSKTLDATAPLDYTYSSANPYKERTSEYQKLFGGFGQGIAPDGPPRRYWYAEKADLSVDGLWMKGPAFELHRETIPNAGFGAPGGEVRQLIMAPYGPSDAPAMTLFAISEKGVYKRGADASWTDTLTVSTVPALEVGEQPQQAVFFTHRGTTPIPGLYVTTSLGRLFRWNYQIGTGGAWQMADQLAGQGPPDGAYYIERVGDELWVAGRFSVTKVEDDPFVRANYSGTIITGEDYLPMGDRTTQITWLRQVDDTLYIFKQDGIYTIDTEGLDHELFPTLRDRGSTSAGLTNGKNAAVWLDRIWFTYGDQTFTLDASGNLRPDGLEQMLENTSPVKGRWIGGAGHNTWFFYEVYYNSQTGASYLVKHGTWIEEGEGQATPGVAQFAEAHHGALYDWPDKRATSVTIIPCPTEDPSGNDRLIVGFSDSTIEWVRLPKHSPNPATDEYTEFTTYESYVYLPQHHSGYRADNKLWHAMTAFGPHLSVTEWVDIEYTTDVANPFASWVLVDEANPHFTLPGERKNLKPSEVDFPVFGRALQIRVHLDKDPNPPYSPHFLSPIIEGIAIHESIRPAFSREFTFLVKLGSFLPKRDGTVDRRRAPFVQDELLRTCAQVGPVRMLLPTGVTEEMTIVGYEDRLFSRQNVRDHTWGMSIRAIQLRTITEGAPQTQPPSSPVWTYDTLETYTLDELEGII